MNNRCPKCGKRIYLVRDGKRYSYVCLSCDLIIDEKKIGTIQELVVLLAAYVAVFLLGAVFISFFPI